jgi:hypothetical protein
LHLPGRVPSPLSASFQNTGLKEGVIVKYFCPKLLVVLVSNETKAVIMRAIYANAKVGERTARKLAAGKNVTLKLYKVEELTS